MFQRINGGGRNGTDICTVSPKSLPKPSPPHTSPLPPSPFCSSPLPPPPPPFLSPLCLFLFVCLSVRLFLSVSLSVRLSVSVCLPACLPASPSIRPLSVCHCLFPSSVCLSACLSAYLPACLSVCLSACLSACLYVCLSVSLPLPYPTIPISPFRFPLPKFPDNLPAAVAMQRQALGFRGGKYSLSGDVERSCPTFCRTAHVPGPNEERYGGLFVS